ncbi:ABC transporter substrate-binding protein [uncultured Methylobacterium sp.]|uniref:ABC transporter substrate-binding protein n=1 Tax=uncultured Methylobacterium sp. TaxID=157278 RepID=UPI0035CA2816
MTVIDPSPVNWLSVTWNTLEEANRVDHDGIGQPSLAEGWGWLDGETLELTMREAVHRDGERFDAAMFKLDFDNVQEWTNPHSPGAFLNFARDETCEAVDDETIRMRFPGGDSAAVMKLPGMHLPSTRFLERVGLHRPGEGVGRRPLVSDRRARSVGDWSVRAHRGRLAER